MVEGTGEKEGAGELVLVVTEGEREREEAGELAIGGKSGDLSVLLFCCFFHSRFRMVRR
jgi:hypothetical protein